MITNKYTRNKWNRAAIDKGSGQEGKNCGIQCWCRSGVGVEYEGRGQYGERFCGGRAKSQRRGRMRLVLDFRSPIMIYTEGVALAALYDPSCDPVARLQETCAQQAHIPHSGAGCCAPFRFSCWRLTDRSVVLTISNNKFNTAW